MSKSLFGWIFRICYLIFWPIIHPCFMSKKMMSKCCSSLCLITPLSKIFIYFFGIDERQRKTSNNFDSEEGDEYVNDSNSFSSIIIHDESDMVKPVKFNLFKHDKFAIDCRVRFFDAKGFYQGGTVRWTGYKVSILSEKLVVVRLDDGQQPGSTDGEFEGQRLVQAEPGVHYLMMSESGLIPITLKLGDYCLVAPNCQRLCMPKSQGFVRRINGSAVTLIPYDMDYEKYSNMQNNKKFEFSDHLLTTAPPPVTDERSDVASPISLDKLERFCGRNKGIQGHRNSCYLDTLLFSLFTFSDVILDDLLEKEQQGNISDTFYMTLNCLRYQIVYPLRASHFVSDEHVDFLRRFIAKETGKEQFLGDTRDIPECMEALFGKILSWTPQLEIGSIGPNGDAHFNQSFVVEIVSSEGVDVPTTQKLLEKASLDLEFCFRDMPNFLFLQLPRVAGRSSIVIPSLQLDLKNILHKSVKECYSCGRNAALQFPHLAEAGGLANSFLCRSCAAQQGLDAEAARQLPDPIVPDGEEPESRLELTAVLCIERSHYNCFARCQDRWVFFDSMSDQEELFDPNSNNMKKFNIPCVKAVPEFHQWIEQSEEEFKRDGLKTFLHPLPEKEAVHRLFSYAYMCLYTVNTY